MEKGHSLRPYVFGAIAVLLWSTSALVASAMEGTADATTLVVGLQLGGIAVNGLIVFKQRARLSRAWGDLEAADRRRFAGCVAAFGLLLATYYWLFYYSIQRGPDIPVNILNFLWPMLTPVAAQLVFRHSETRMTRSDGLLLLVAFVGAALVAWDFRAANPFRGTDVTFLLAIVAAATAALYLNFAVAARRYIESTPLIYTGGLVTSLPMSLLLLGPGGFSLSLDVTSLLAMAYLGVLVLGCGSALWLTALSEGNPVTVSSLAYLTPVFSTLLLHIVLGADLVGSVALGAIIIVVANVLLQSRYRHFHALRGSLVAFFVAGIVVYLDPEFLRAGVLNVPDDYLAAVFSILAGFTLTRVWNRNRKENELIGSINSDLLELIAATSSMQHRGHRAKARDAIRGLVESMVAFSYCRTTEQWHATGQRVRASVAALRADFAPLAGSVDATLRSVRDRIGSWTVLGLDRVGPGEMLLISTLGLMSVVSFVVRAGQSLWGDLFAVLFAAVTTYIVLLVRDYNVNRAAHDARGILVMQEPLKELGVPYYLPSSDFLLEMASLRTDFEVTIDGDSERVDSRHLEAERRWMTVAAVLMSTASVTVVVALLASKYL